MRCRKRRGEVASYHPFGEQAGSARQTVELTSFQGPGSTTFEEVSAALRANDSSLYVLIQAPDRVVRGSAFAVDESGILRISQDGKPGVRVLVWREGETLFGEFAD